MLANFGRHADSNGAERTADRATRRRASLGGTTDRETGMGATREYQPGEPAPASGEYEQHRVLGSATGVRAAVLAGQRLPPAPRGFTWVMVDYRGVAPSRLWRWQPSQPTAHQMRAEATAYRQLAETAATVSAKNELLALAAGFAAFAAQLEAADRVQPSDPPNQSTKLESR
jgi:hypothetical protein